MSCTTHHYCECFGDRMHKLEDKVHNLKMTLHNIYAIYAGSESCDDNTATQYLVRLIHQMKELAAQGKVL